MGWVGGGDCCEEVGCWGVEFGGEDCGPPVLDGAGVGKELGLVVRSLFGLDESGCFKFELAYFENVWICWMERSGDDGC